MWSPSFDLQIIFDVGDFETIHYLEWEDNQSEGGQQPLYCDIRAGKFLVHLQPNNEDGKL